MEVAPGGDHPGLLSSSPTKEKTPTRTEGRTEKCDQQEGKHMQRIPGDPS